MTPKPSTGKMQKELFPNDSTVSIKVEDDADDDDKKISVNTPTAKKSLLNGPRTPTPFKNALDEFRKIRGQTYVPSSPNGFAADITEIMNNERQQDSTIDSVYETDSSVLTQNANVDGEGSNVSNPKRLSFDEIDSNSQQSMKKAKKSLESTWNAESPKDFPYMVETPVSIIIIPLATFHTIHFFFFANFLLNGIFSSCRAKR